MSPPQPHCRVASALIRNIWSYSIVRASPRATIGLSLAIPRVAVASAAPYAPLVRRVRAARERLPTNIKGGRFLPPFLCVEWGGASPHTAIFHLRHCERQRSNPVIEYWIGSNGIWGSPFHFVQVPRRFAPRNDGEKAPVTPVAFPTFMVQVAQDSTYCEGGINDRREQSDGMTNPSTFT